MSDNIQVAIRLRPLNEREIKNEKSPAWKTLDKKTIFQLDKNVDQKYIFDRVYDCNESTNDIYEETVKEIVIAGFEGFNGTIFAYGQTSSGKTYTMSGSKNQMGIIPLAIQSIFSEIDNSPDREFLLRVSYMEIYNEKITDLLDPEEKSMKMLEDENRQIIVQGLHEEVIRSGADVINLKKKGDARRRVAETARNEESSRSHAIFQIIIESQERQFNEEDLIDESVRLSNLYFVDLAGSEKASENSGERFREGCAINKSLMTLGQVISKLSDGISNHYINYRDSKLTRLLQNGLGGNSKTAIICTINPIAIDETNSTLRFASRAKIIKNKPTINELTDTSDKAILKRYQKEIIDLKQQLETFKNQTPQKYLNPYFNTRHEQEKLELKKKYTSVIAKLKSMVCVSTTSPVKKKIIRRETWCPGVLKRKLEQAGHLPALGVIGPSSANLGKIVEESSLEPNPKIHKTNSPVKYVNAICQTDKIIDSDNLLLLKYEKEYLQNQMASMSEELQALKSRPAKQRRISVENHDETMEFLEFEMRFVKEQNEQKAKLEMECTNLQEERIKHDESLKSLQAERQRVDAIESENSHLLTSLKSSQDRVRNLEQELNSLQNQLNMASNITYRRSIDRRSVDRPLLNLSERSKQLSCGNCGNLKDQVFSLESEVQVQETEIQKLTRDLEKCREQLKKKCDEVRFLSLQTTDQKERLEKLQQEATKMSDSLENKTPISEMPEVIELTGRLTGIMKERDSLQQKLKSKSEELTYLSRQSAIYQEQLESRAACPPESEDKKIQEEIETLRKKLAEVETEKNQAKLDLSSNKLYSNTLKDQLQMKADECSLLQKNLDATHEEVVNMRKTLVEFKETLLAKEELILELSLVKPTDTSSQLQSPLFSVTGMNSEATDSLPDEAEALAMASENLNQHDEPLVQNEAGVRMPADDENKDSGKNERDDLWKELSNVRREKAELEEKYQQLLRERDNMEEVVARQSQELSAAQQSSVSTENGFEQSRSKMESEVDALVEKCKIQEEECARLNGELVKAKQEYDNELAGITKGNEEKESGLKLEIEAQSAELCKLQQQLTVSEQDHKEKAKECLELINQVGSLTEKLLEQTEKQLRLEKELEVKSEECLQLADSLRQESEQKEKELTEEREEVDDDDKDEIILQIPTNEADITLLESLREELDATREECNRLREEGPDSQECETLKKNLKSLGVENENLITACASMREQVCVLKDDKRRTEELLNSLRTEFEEKCLEHDTLVTEMRTIRLDSENRLTACTTLSGKISNLEKAKAEADDVLESLREEFKAKEEEIELLRQEMQKPKKCSKCEALQQELALLQSRVSSDKLVPNNDQTGSMSSGEKEGHSVPSVSESASAETSRGESEELSVCRHLLESKAEECRQLQRELSNIQDDYHVLKMSLEDLQESSQLADPSLHNQLSQCQAELDSRTKECSSLKTELDKMEEAVVQQTKEGCVLNEKISLLEESLRSKTEECNALIEKLAALNLELVAKKAEEDPSSVGENQLGCSRTKAKEIPQEGLGLCEEHDLQLSEKENLCEKNNELNQNCSNVEVKDSLGEEITKKNSLLEEVKAAKSQIAVLQEEVNRLQQSQENVSVNQTLLTADDPHRLVEELKTQSGKCSLLTEEIDRLRCEMESLKTEKEREAETMRRSIEELEGKSLDYDVLVEELNRSNSAEFHDRNRDLRAELTRKTNELEEAREENTHLLIAMRHNDENLGLVRNELSESLSELESLQRECNCLKEDLAEMNSKTAKLQESLGFAQEQEKLTGEKLLAKRLEWDQLTKELSNVQKECDSLKMSLLSLDQENNRLTDLEKDLHSTRLDLDTKKSECLQLKLQNDTLQAEIESLKISLLNLNNENQHLLASEGKSISLQGELDSKSRDYANLSQEFADLKKQNHDLIAAKESEILAVRTELESRQAELAELTEHYQSLTEKMGEVEAENVGLRESLIRMDEQNDQLSKLNHRLVINEKEIISKTEECASLSAELEALKSSRSVALDEMRRQLESKAEECSGLTKELSILKERAAREEERLRQEVESKCTEYTLLAGELAAEKQSKVSMLEELQHKLSAHIEESALLSEKVVNSEREHSDAVSKLEQELSEKSQECNSLSTELAGLLQKQSRLEMLLGNHELLGEEKLRGLIEERTTLEEKLKIQEEKNLEEVKVHLDTIENLSKENQLKAEMISNLQEKDSNSNHKNEETLSEMEKELQEKTQKCQDLSQQLESLQAEFTKAFTHLKKTKSEKNELSERLLELENKSYLCDLYWKENQKNILKLEELEEEKLETTLKLNKMEAELKEKSDSNSNHKNEETLSEMEKELQEKTQKCQDLSQQLESLQAEFTKAFTHLKKTKSEKNELSERLLELENKSYLCDLYWKENQKNILKLEELEEEKLETTLKLNKMEAELKEKSELNLFMNSTSSTEFSKKSPQENGEPKSILFQESNFQMANYEERIKSLCLENQKKDEIIQKLEIDVSEKKDCIQMLENRTFCDLKGKELESLQRQLSQKSMHLVWAESGYKLEKAQTEKKMKSYEETIEILNEKIKSLKEELRLLHAEKQDESIVKVSNVESQQETKPVKEAAVVQSLGFIDHMAVITLEAENSKLNRKIERLKEKLCNALINHETVKKELQTLRDTSEKKENSSPKQKKKLVEKSTNTEILKLSDVNTSMTPAKINDKKSPTRLKSIHNLQLSAAAANDKSECNNQ